MEHRRNRWPNTAKLRLLINDQIAAKTSRAGNHGVGATLRGQA
ncbi:hypothetical protein OIE75_01815 [Streptomyces sp. NBC_01723]|nr:MULTISPECIES: hypothetical protein [unclassified Streptomyces]MDQ0401710.1 hypothetical protein [Streptomyces sp. DSM 40167]